MKKNVRKNAGMLLIMASLCGGSPALAQGSDPNLLVCADKGYTIKNATEASGKSTVSYKWYEKVNGGTFEEVSDKIEASLHRDAKKSAGTYAYVRMAFSEDCEGGVASNTFTVVVLKPEKPTVTADVAAVCAGTDVSFAVTSPLPGATYTWSGDTGTPTGDDNSTYTVSGAATGTKGVYAAASFTYTVGTLTPKTCVSDLSTLAQAEVNPLPEITNVTIPDLCGGGVKDLAVTVAAGTATVTETATIKWYSDNGGNSEVATGATYSPNLTASATYYVGAVVDATGCESASLTQVDATINLYEGVIEGTED